MIGTNEMSTSTRKRRHRALQQPSTAGFTLIEVMIVLALTLVMMSMFAVIFGMTGTFVTKQKGVGENDQSARILTTVLKTDLEARTMRLLAPFHPNMTATALAALAPANLQGYFYVSENDPTDDTDDVLQFTINLGVSGLTTLNNPTAGTRLYGNALFLAPPWQPTTTYGVGALVRPSTAGGNTTGFAFKNNGTTPITSAGVGNEPNWSTVTTLGGTIGDNGGTWTAIASPLDQPDGDDGQITYAPPATPTPTLDPANSTPNNTGASQYAEVCYFLRHGNLIRRVLLIRQPYDPSAGAQTPQPNDGTGAFLIPGAYPPYPAGAGSGNFWTDFDYAARINTGLSPGVLFPAVSATLNSLDNTAGATAPGPQLGLPYNRFGFDQTFSTTAGPVANGAPREFAFQYNSATNTVTGAVYPTGPMFYFGRYTQEETSNSNFQFPGKLPIVGGTGISPMGSAAVLALDSASYTMWLLGVNPPTAPVSLAGGPRRGEDILLTNVVSFDVKLWDARYSETTAGVDVNRNGIIDPGPGGFADIGHTASGDFAQANNIFPVYGPQIDTGYALPAAPLWAPAFTRTFNGLTYNYNNVFDTWYPFFNFDNLPRTYDALVADTASVYAPAPYRPRVGTAWTATTAYALNQLIDPADTANGYVYQCTVAGTSGATEPFTLGDQPGGTITDGGVTWTVLPPLNVKAIQITVKYLDPTQNLLRQVTIVQSLTQ